MPKGDGQKRPVCLSVRLTQAELTALHALAAKIGYGATATGIIHQLITDRLKAEGGKR